MFTTLNQSLAFHQSPEAFISNRLQELSAKDPNSLPATTGGPSITRASILNRHVHVISSYQICKDILNSNSDQDSGSVEAAAAAAAAATSPSPQNPQLFSAGPAYHELMKDWFGEDSILLEDDEAHARHKEAWTSQTASLPIDLEPQLRATTRAFIAREFRPGRRIDLYETLKTLAWQLLLGAFLGLDEDDRTHTQVEALQETLLRGQFSLFPVAVNTFFYQSARSRGLRARQQLQQLLSQRIREQTPGACPLLRRGDVGRDDVARHCLLFTSSIANKALASLLTASVMNVFLMPGRDLVGMLRGQVGEGRRGVLKSMLRETERLSPPVVGVMRRVEEEVVLRDGSAGEGHVVPKGHDVWMYFVGASREESVFEEAQIFRFDRFMVDADTPQGFAFGAGGKTCLGKDVARLMVSIVVEELLDANIELHGESQSEGVQAWLGWKATKGAEAFAKDLKQLPCQRPRRPVWIEVSASREAG